MAKRNKKSQTSNLVNKLGPAPSKPVASDQMKSTASGFQMKFNTMNVSNFVTGGSSSTSSSGNYGNQSSINSIVGKKVGTATQIPQKVAQETMETKGGDSLISSLAKMFSFMQQTREEDIKRRDTERAFSEEKMTEEQKRHEQFLKVLKEYTSIGTSKLTPSPDGGGIMDFIKDMFGSFIEPFKWLIDNKALLLRILGWAMGPVGAAILGVATVLLLAEILSQQIKQNVSNYKTIGPKEAQALLENGSPNEIASYPGGRDALVDIVQNGAKNASTALDDYESGKITKARLNELGGETKLKEMKNETGLTIPEIKDLPEQVQPRPKKRGYGQIQWDKLYGDRYNADGTLKIQKSLDTATPLPEGMTPSTAGGGRGNINPPMAIPNESAPSATPVSPTPSTSSVNDIIAKNADLMMNDYSFGSGSAQPIISTSSNSTSSPDKPMSSSASQRDDTAIINRVFDRVRGGV